MLGAERLVTDCDSPKEERLGLVRLPEIAQHTSKVAEARCRTGMLGAKHLLINREQRAQTPRARPGVSVSEPLVSICVFVGQENDGEVIGGRRLAARQH